MAGVGWAMININSLPTVVDMGSLAEVGTFTGLYYFSSQAASIVSPPLIALSPIWQKVNTSCSPMH